MEKISSSNYARLARVWREVSPTIRGDAFLEITVGGKAVCGFAVNLPCMFNTVRSTILATADLRKFIRS